MSVSLLKHQKIALAWMVSRENSTHCSGGILADDQVISYFLPYSNTFQSFFTIFLCYRQIVSCDAGSWEDNIYDCNYTEGEASTI